MAMGAAETMTDLANLALEALGETRRLLNLETDTGTVAESMRLSFWPVWDETLEGYPWNCARKRARLPALTLTPPFGFARYFGLPADFLGVQEIAGELEGEAWAIEVAGAEGAEERVIACDFAAPLDLVYTFRLRNIGLASPSMKGAFIHGFACRSAMAVTGNSEKRDDQFALWKDMVAIGQRNDGRQSSRRRAPDSEILTVRGG